MASASTLDVPTKDEKSSSCAKAAEPTYQLVDQESQVSAALDDILHDRGGGASGRTVSVDCEALNLGRDGKLSLVSVATPERAYLFDIKALGSAVFDRGLRSLLQDEDVLKLMFDCRSDSDCLKHLFQVDLTNVLDLQLLEIILREERGEVNLSDHPRVTGLLSCFETYIKDDDTGLVSAKKSGRVSMYSQPMVWLERPLGGVLLNYAAGDVRGLFPLHEALVADCSEGALARARAASANYLDFFRSKPSLSGDEYERNAFLPMYVIPAKGYTIVPWIGRNTRCYGCKRRFKLSDFSKTQLRKGTPRCAVCKLIKLGIDKRTEGHKQWERYNDDQDADNYYGDFDSDDFTLSYYFL